MILKNVLESKFDLHKNWNFGCLTSIGNLQVFYRTDFYCSIFPGFGLIILKKLFMCCRLPFRSAPLWRWKIHIHKIIIFAQAPNELPVEFIQRPVLVSDCRCTFEFLTLNVLLEPASISMWLLISVILSHESRGTQHFISPVSFMWLNRKSVLES